MNAVFANPPPIQEIVGQIHEPFRPAEIAPPCCNAGNLIQMLLAEELGRVGVAGGKHLQGEGRPATGQRVQLFRSNHIGLGAHEIQQGHRRPIV